jgi:DNA-binding NarL/FixJ family response regulator
MMGAIKKKATGHSSSPRSTVDGGAVGMEGRRPAAPSELDEKPLRIFIADDSRLVMERLVALLATVEEVQIVGAARTGSAAIRGIHHLSPDLVILDLQMPDGSGLDVLKTIKQATVPPIVMMLTNVAYPQYRAECRQWGADYFFDKSQDFEQVVETCRKLVSATESKLGTGAE